MGRDDGWDSGLYLVVTFSKVGYYVLCAWGERKSLGEFKRCLFQMICLIFGGIFFALPWTISGILSNRAPKKVR